MLLYSTRVVTCICTQYTHFNLLDDLINLDRFCRKESIYNIVIYLGYIMDIWVLCYFLYDNRTDTVVLSKGFGGGGVVVVVVDPLFPDYWGKSASVVLWGFAASFSRQSSSRAATPEGSLHKSRADSVVGICGQLKRCCVVCS